MLAFYNANAQGMTPSHHEFHFTNIPISGLDTYGSAKVGTSTFDIVSMIQYCISVLRGQQPENNDRKITKSVAIILLVHYLGDIHQPLHVGAEYFDGNGAPFTPTFENKGFGTQGANKLSLYTFSNGGLNLAAEKMHSYWDGQTVLNAFGERAPSRSAKRLASNEPDGWRLSGELKLWPVQMADSIMPYSREAHSRLRYSNILINPPAPKDIGCIDVLNAQGKVVTDKWGKKKRKCGRADEKPPVGGQEYYAIWASEVVKKQIHLGGWRLAEILRLSLS